VADPALFQKHLDRARNLSDTNQPITPPPAFPPGGAGALGGEMSMGFNPMGMPPPPLNLGIGYSNVYGTDINASVDPTTQSIRGSATIPIGDARNALYLEASGAYNANTRQPEGFLGFRKRNVSSDPSTAALQLGLDDPNRDKYSYGVHLNKQPPQMPMMGMPTGMPTGMPMGMPMGMPTTQLQPQSAYIPGNLFGQPLSPEDVQKGYGSNLYTRSR
jgi:hypothetical protein